MKIIEETFRILQTLCFFDTKHISSGGYGRVQAILTSDLNTHSVAAKFMPKILNPHIKTHLIKICQDFCQQVMDDPTLRLRVITGDQTWVYSFNTDTKQQSSQWRSPASLR